MKKVASRWSPKLFRCFRQNCRFTTMIQNSSNKLSIRSTQILQNQSGQYDVEFFVDIEEQPRETLWEMTAEFCL
uniref:Uncharacterized protein n=1 Tax=Trichuris muris TaxID=70415 RepID=A0A5S6PZX4_TRIMR